MAKVSHKRPNYNSKQGRKLKLYTDKKSKHFDENFYNQIKSLRPSWVISLEEYKEKLLQRAAEGKDRPLNKSKLSIVFYECTKDTPRNKNKYDKEFTEKLKELAPDWFVKRNDSAGKKKEILKIAVSGGNLPKKLRENFYSYVKKSSESYDKHFFNKIKSLRPDWFKKKNSPERSKIEILELIERGEPKPKKGPLRSAFYTYTRGKFYDPEFTEKVKKLAPHWFLWKRDPFSKKEELLSMTDKPRLKELYRKRLYNCMKSDKEFADKIKTLAPHWFKK